MLQSGRAGQLMNTYGRVALCGVIAEYYRPGRRAEPDLLEVIYKRSITLRGLLRLGLHPQVHQSGPPSSGTAGSRREQVRGHRGRLRWAGEQLRSAFVALYRGENVGKKLVKLA
ncbi:hypothetical protein ZWY2020_014002 [Hordeum vulgare]|nr:hypothetical protein ZWY2020_014002 [Hordeum vulgare]